MPLSQKLKSNYTVYQLNKVGNGQVIKISFTIRLGGES